LIFLDFDEAYGYAAEQAHIFDGLDLLSDGSFRIRLEEQAPAELPEGVTVLASQEPTLPIELEQIETILSMVGDPSLPPELKPWPPMSPWWRKVVGRVYFFNKPEIVARVGRRGGKSTTLCRIAVYEAVYAKHRDSASERGYFAIISAERGQAQERLLTCARILQVLGIEHKPTKDMIDLVGINRGIRVFTASVSGVVSFTSIGALCDEECHWKDKDSERNPAPEVLKNLRPTMLTNSKTARLWHLSAPYSVFDEHYAAFERGTDRTFQTCFYAPTWVANPSETEETTRSREPDEQTWQCQYKAIPLPSEENTFFPSDHIDSAIKLGGCPPLLLETVSYVAGGDFAFRRNSSALVVGKGGQTKEDRTPFFSLVSDREWTPVEKSLKPGDVLREAIDIAEHARCESLCCDLHYIETVREHLEDTKIGLAEYPSHDTATAYVRVRVLLAQGRLDLSRASTRLISQLKQTTARPTATGLEIKNPEIRGAHGDLVSALVCMIYQADQLGLGDDTTGGKRRFAKDETPSGSEWVEYADDWDED
jgi:hypothetical protein